MNHVTMMLKYPKKVLDKRLEYLLGIDGEAYYG